MIKLLEAGENSKHSIAALILDPSALSTILNKKKKKTLKSKSYGIVLHNMYYTHFIIYLPKKKTIHAYIILLKTTNLEK